MCLYEFIKMYDNWNASITVNDNNLNPIFTGNIYYLVETQSNIHGKEVVSFGFYDGVITVRVE